MSAEWSESMKEKRKEGLSRIVFFFTIYGVIREVLLHYNNPSAIDMKTILCYSGITLMGVFLYGICAYISNSLSHTAAYDLLYEIRVQLMEKRWRGFPWVILPEPRRVR